MPAGHRYTVDHGDQPCREVSDNDEVGVEPGVVVGCAGYADQPILQETGRFLARSQHYHQPSQRSRYEQCGRATATRLTGDVRSERRSRATPRDEMIDWPRIPRIAALIRLTAGESHRERRPNRGTRRHAGLELVDRGRQRRTPGGRPADMTMHRFSSPASREPGPLARCFVDLADTPDEAPEVQKQLVTAAQLTAERVTAADYASVTALRDGGFTTVATSGELARAVDQAQYDDDAGPCLD